MIYALEVFLLHMSVPMYLGHRYSVLRFPFDEFFSVTNMKCPSSSILIDFTFKSILLAIRIATPSCFLCPFDWKIFS